jgi:DNA invertase Pin-like site-specific DNA recombinase
MIYGYARVSTDYQGVAAQVKELPDAGAEKSVREKARGTKTDRLKLRRTLDKLDSDDVLILTRLDRLAIDARLAQQACCNRRQGRNFPLPWTHGPTPPRRTGA